MDRMVSVVEAESKAEEELRQKLEVEEGGKKTKAFQSECEEKNKKREKEQHKKSPFDF